MKEPKMYCVGTQKYCEGTQKSLSKEITTMTLKGLCSSSTVSAVKMSAHF